MNAPARQPVPLRPDVNALGDRARRSLSRALLASARACFETDRNHHRVAEKTWPADDGALAILNKGAVAPASTANTGALLQTIVEAAVLGAVGAGAQLLRRALTLNFGRAATISLPTLIADASHGAFVGEGMPVPAYGGNTATPVTLTPHKLMAIWTATRETIDSSNAEALIEECAKRSIGLTLDAILFDAVAGDSVRPAGLRNGVAALGASTATDPFEKMLGDVGALLAAVAPIGGEAILIANTARAQMMPARSRGGTLPVVLGSPAVAAADLIAIAVDGLAAAIAPEIEVLASKGATVHMDTAPLPISATGTPNIVAAPTRDLWTTDSVGLRLRLPLTWAKRDPRAVAWVTTTW